MPKLHQIILIHAAATSKPAVGAPCNGCGVCCLFEPCPLGAVLSRRGRGACVAVRWDSATAQYRCGALSEPHAVLRSLFPERMGRVAIWMGPALGRLAKRWIGVGLGCDSTLEAIRPMGEPLP